MSMEKVGEIIVPTEKTEETVGMVNAMMSMMGPMIMLMFLVIIMRSVMKTTASRGIG